MYKWPVVPQQYAKITHAGSSKAIHSQHNIAVSSYSYHRQVYEERYLKRLGWQRGAEAWSAHDLRHAARHRSCMHLAEQPALQAARPQFAKNDGFIKSPKGYHCGLNIIATKDVGCIRNHDGATILFMNRKRTPPEGTPSWLNPNCPHPPDCGKHPLRLQSRDLRELGPQQWRLSSRNRLRPSNPGTTPLCPLPSHAFAPERRRSRSLPLDASVLAGRMNRRRWFCRPRYRQKQGCRHHRRSPILFGRGISSRIYGKVQDR